MVLEALTNAFLAVSTAPSVGGQIMAHIPMVEDRRTLQTSTLADEPYLAKKSSITQQIRIKKTQSSAIPF